MKRSNTATFSNNRPGSLKRAESKEDLEEKSANKRVAALEAEDNEEQQRELREAQGERGKGSRFRGLAKRSSDRGTNLPWYSSISLTLRLASPRLCASPRFALPRLSVLSLLLSLFFFSSPGTSSTQWATAWQRGTASPRSPSSLQRLPRRLR